MYRQSPPVVVYRVGFQALGLDCTASIGCLDGPLRILPAESSAKAFEETASGAPLHWPSLSGIGLALCGHACQPGLCGKVAMISPLPFRQRVYFQAQQDIIES